jgi:hypothetical protein
MTVVKSLRVYDDGIGVGGFKHRIHRSKKNRRSVPKIDSIRAFKKKKGVIHTKSLDKILKDEIIK